MAGTGLREPPPPPNPKTMALPPVGNEFGWRDVRAWLEAPPPNPRPRGISAAHALCIYGPSGIGKTSGLLHLAGEAGYDVRVLDSTSYPDGGPGALEAWIQKAASCYLLDALEGRRRPRLILIDEVETLGSMDRSFFASIQRIFQSCAAQPSKGALPWPYVPLVAIGHERKMSFGTVVRLGPIDPGSMYTCLRALPAAGGLAPSEVASICEDANGNLSHAVHRLGLAAAPAAAVAMDETISVAALFQTDPPPSKQQAAVLFSSAADVLPRFHESLPKELSHRTGGRARKLHVYRRILEVIHDYDTWDDGSGDILWEHLSAAPASLLPLLPRRKNAATETGEAFSRRLTQLSLQKKTRREVYRLSGLFEHLGI